MSEIDEGYNSNSSFNSEKEENFEQIRFKSITNKRNKKLSYKKLSRTSVQAPVSFLKKFGNNKENIQPSLITSRTDVTRFSYGKCIQIRTYDKFFF